MGRPNPRRVPEIRAQGSASLVKLKPTFYFNGILFQGSHDAPTGEIYSMNPDGSSLFRLTNDNVTDAYPDVSPLGPSFIWVRFSGNGQTSEIYSQNLDGSKRKQLTVLNTVVTSPRYSPDGTKIAFTAEVPGVGAEIFTMNADGTGVGRLTLSGKQLELAVLVARRVEDRIQQQRQLRQSWRVGDERERQRADDAGKLRGTWLHAPEVEPGGERDRGRARRRQRDLRDRRDVRFADGVHPSAPTDYDMMPTWSKDGKRIIFSSLRSDNGTYDLFSTMPLRRGSTALPPVDRLTTLLGKGGVAGLLALILS